MDVYSLDVEISTHDALGRGVLALRLLGSQRAHHRVVVEAGSMVEAALIAQQMAACHGMPTGCYARI